MYRKSIGFFTLVGLLWLVLWQYIPDRTPDQLSFSDFLRGLTLLFSFLAFSFVLLMLTVRYRGVDIATNFIPHAGIVLWLGKHAYEFSQPKTIFLVTYKGPLDEIQLIIKTNNNTYNSDIKQYETKSIKVGYINQNPQFTWSNKTNKICKYEVQVESNLKSLGKNITFNITIIGGTYKLYFDESTN